MIIFFYHSKNIILRTKSWKRKEADYTFCSDGNIKWEELLQEDELTKKKKKKLPILPTYTDKRKLVIFILPCYLLFQVQKKYICKNKIKK